MAALSLKGTIDENAERIAADMTEFGYMPPDVRKILLILALLGLIKFSDTPTADA